MLVRSRRLIGARLALAALVPSILLTAGQAVSVSAHPMSPAVSVDTQVDNFTQAAPDGQVKFGCQMAAAAFPCYGPDQIRAAYDIQSLLDSGITGTGRTIVIIGAFQGATAQADLALFDRAWGLPAADLQVTAPDGTTTFDRSSTTVQRMWALEASIDVEWAHAIAPGAHLNLVVAKSEADADILRATEFAIDNNLGDVISQSFGEAESCQDARFFAHQHAAFKKAQQKGITLIAASGDTGAAQHTCDGTLVAGVSFPASDPLVTAVGGTHLVADRVSGAWQSETGWGDVSGASGGGFSSRYHRPIYQVPMVDSHSGRGLPDVALGSSAFGSVVVAAFGRLGQSAGTSAATAEWAGIAALADQAAGSRLGTLNPSLYAIAKSSAYGDAMHDISAGNNGFRTFAGFTAGVSWDAVTGLGTPDVAMLVPVLVGLEGAENGTAKEE